MIWLLAFAYFIVSRLAYVIGVGVMLHRQEKFQVFTHQVGAEAGYWRFRRIAVPLMNNDGFSFVVLCLATIDTLQVDIPRWVLAASGVLLILFGGGIKIWAAKRLGGMAYYWADFFWDTPPKPLDPPGPYKYLNNPMYTVGYLPMYGAALVVASWQALAGALFAHIGILLFHWSVERPHWRRISGGVSTP